MPCPPCLLLSLKIWIWPKLSQAGLQSSCVFLSFCIRFYHCVQKIHLLSVTFKLILIVISLLLLGVLNYLIPETVMSCCLTPV